jgi:hypothetical protein
MWWIMADVSIADSAANKLQLYSSAFKRCGPFLTSDISSNFLDPIRAILSKSFLSGLNATGNVSYYASLSAFLETANKIELPSLSYSLMNNDTFTLKINLPKINMFSYETAFGAASVFIFFSHSERPDGINQWKTQGFGFS